MKIRILAIVLIATVLTGCQVFEWTGLVKVPMDSDKANERVESTVAKHFDAENYKLIDISWSEGRRLQNNMEYLYFTLIGRDGRRYNQVIKVGGDYQGAREIEADKSEEIFDFDAVRGLSAEDVKPEIIKQHYRNAKQALPDTFKFKGIERYMIRVDQNTGEVERRFTMDVTENGNATKIRSSTLVTEYYDLDFAGYDDGSVEYLE